MTHNSRIVFRVDARLVLAAEAKARREHMTLPEYMRQLVRTDLRAA